MTTGPDFISIINSVFKEKFGVDLGETPLPPELRDSIDRLGSIPEEPEVIRGVLEKAFDENADAAQGISGVLNLFKAALTSNRDRVKDVVNDMGLNFSTQLAKVREIRANSDDTSYSIPNFYVPDDISFFDFLTSEKVYSKPKLREAANREVSLVKGKTYSATEKLSKAEERTNLSLFMIRAGLFILKGTGNPHLAFDLSIEHRLIRWGLDVLGLPVPKKLNDYKELYSVSQKFADEYLGFNATGVLVQEDDFLPTQGLGVIEMLSELLDSKTDETLSYRERNAVAAILFGVSSITVCEEVMIPILYRFPTVAKMFHSTEDATDYFCKLDKILIGPNTLHPIFEVLCSVLVIAQDQDFRPENNLRKSVKMYFDNLGRLSENLLKVFPYKKELYKMQQGALVEITTEIFEFYTKLKRFFEGVDDTYLTGPSRSSIERYLDSVDSLESNVRLLLESSAEITPDFTDEISRLLVGHNKTDLDNYKNISDVVDELILNSKAAIDAGDFDGASEYIAKAKAYKEGLSPAIDIHTEVVESIDSLFQTKLDSIKQIESESPESLKVRDLELDNQMLSDQLAKANEKVARMSESLSENYQSKALPPSAPAISSSGSAPIMTEELSKVMFDRPSQATVVDAIVAVQQLYPNVVLADNTLDRAKYCSYRNVPKLFSYLNMICNEYYTLICGGCPDSEAKSIFGSVYSRGESDTVMSSPKLKALREFKFDGERKLVAKHLTIGTRRDPTMTVQVHFDIVDGKVLIGRVGEHLPVASS